MKSTQSSVDDPTQRRFIEIMTRVGFDVTVVEGPDAGVHVALDAGSAAKILIGKGTICDLKLTDSLVSRRHVALEFEGRHILVTDLGSTNGTYVNNTRIVSAYVEGGDSIRVGATVLRVKPVADAPPHGLPPAFFGRLIGVSPRMLNVFQLSERLAPTDVPVIIEGETGTGKELLAECIHEASPRAAGPFIVLDCRTTPRALVEAVLFGEISRADGATTTTRPGVFEQASGGTILIDEPGDLDPEIQGKLLRALDKGQLTRVGDDAITSIDVRVLVATTRDLDKLVEEGTFREDLYFRLAGARIEIPPLRRRRDDVAPLADAFWGTHGGKGVMPPEFLERFEGYDWPGNVRELQRAVGRFIALGDKVSLAMNRTNRRGSSPLDAHRSPSGPASAREPEAPRSKAAPFVAGDDPLSRILAASLPFPEARQRILEEFERAYIEKVLAENDGNVVRASVAAGIARRYFQMIRSRQSK